MIFKNFIVFKQLTLVFVWTAKQKVNKEVFNFFRMFEATSFEF